jgi:hypothetical protein
MPFCLTNAFDGEAMKKESPAWLLRTIGRTNRPLEAEGHHEKEEMDIIHERVLLDGDDRQNTEVQLNGWPMKSCEPKP